MLAVTLVRLFSFPPLHPATALKYLICNCFLWSQHHFFRFLFDGYFFSSCCDIFAFLIFVSSSASFASVLSFAPLLNSILSVLLTSFCLLRATWSDSVSTSPTASWGGGENFSLPLFSSSLPPLHHPTSYRCSSAWLLSPPNSPSPSFQQLKVMKDYWWRKMSRHVFLRKVKCKHKHKAAKSNCPHFCMFWCHAGLTEVKFFFTLPLQKTAFRTTAVHTHAYTHTRGKSKSVSTCMHACVRVCADSLVLSWPRD